MKAGKASVSQGEGGGCYQYQQRRPLKAETERPSWVQGRSAIHRSK